MNNFWSLVRFECKKILSRKITWIAFFSVFTIMLACGVYRIFVSETVDGVRVSAQEEEMQQKAEIKKLAGRKLDDALFDEMLAAMEKEEAFAPYEEIYRNLWKNYFDDEAVPGLSVADLKEQLDIAPEEELFYAVRRQRIEKTMQEQRLTEGEKNYWREVLDKEELPWSYDYSLGVQYTWVAVYTTIVLVALMLAVCLANLFAEEHQKKTDQLVLCSRNGRGVLYGAKLTAGLLFTLVSTALVLMASALPQLLLLGADGMSAPIQLLTPTSLCTMTFGEMLLYVYALAILAAVMYAAITMCCSELFSNSTVTVMALIVVLVLVPMMVYIPEKYRIASQIFELNPINVLAIWSAGDYRLIPFFGSYLNVRQVAPVLYTVLTLLCMWIGRRAYLKFQVGGR